MRLQGINVLIDGYNLEMTKGTGIKTYGITLINALTLLGANVDVLCSRYINSKHPLLAETLFFDSSNNNVRSLNLKSFLLRAYKNFSTAQEVNISDFVTKQQADFVFNYFKNSGKVFNIYDCYQIANNLYKFFPIETKVKIPKKVDIWHSTYPLPINVNKAKRVTTLHDLIPLKLPYATLDDKKFFFKIIKNSIDKSDLILTISEHTKKDILDCFDVKEDKIFVTFQPAIDTSFLINQDEIPNFLKKYKLKYKNYILFVGTIEPRKNVGRLIDAYNGLDTDMQLVIVGKKGWRYEEEIARLEAILGKNFSRKVKLLEYVSNKDLQYLYKSAFCFVFPSLYEGFGLPPLEAMSLGCPVIASNISSLPEVCGDAAIYVNPYDSNDIRQGIENLINNPHMQTQLVEAGKKRVEFFSMENYINKLYNAYSLVI